MRKGIAVSALEDSTGRDGRRIRTITSGGRKRRRPTAAEVDAVSAYLDDVADELERQGTVVETIAIDARKPLSGRLMIQQQVDPARPRGVTTRLNWQQDFGWSLETRGHPGEPEGGWFFLYADPAATPATVEDFLRKAMPTAQPARSGKQGPGRPAVAS